MSDTKVMLADLSLRGYHGLIALIARGGGGTGGGHVSGGGGSSGRSSGGGFSGGTSSGTGSIGGLGLVVLLGGGVTLFVLYLVVMAVMRNRRGGAGPVGSDDVTAGANSVALSGVRLGENASAGVVTTKESLDAGLAEIAAHDPGFEVSAFVSSCERAFFVVQKAWIDRNPNLSRQVMHEAIWQQHKFQIDQYLQSNRQNLLDNLAVQNARLVAADSDASYDTVTVRFFASCADYDIDLSNDKHKVVRGSRDVSEWCEDWVFQRSSKAVTKIGAGTLNEKCPNCGAALDLDLAGICRYCKAPVMSGDYDWVLVRIEQLPSWEFAEATLPT